MHLSANLINDYADSKSGVDWIDRNFYGLFGGSKLIQDGILKESFYLKLSLFFLFVSFLSVLALSFLLHSFFIVAMFFLILCLAWLYSCKPLQFSYHYLGELIIFLTFGPALVMGGYFIQSGIFPDQKSLLLSLCFGFFTTSILFANEVPDYPQDNLAGKHTLVELFGLKRSYLIYLILVLCGFISIIINALVGNLNYWALICLILLPSAFKVSRLLKKFPDDKDKLICSSKLTIKIQNLSALILIITQLI